MSNKENTSELVDTQGLHCIDSTPKTGCYMGTVPCRICGVPVCHFHRWNCTEGEECLSCHESTKRAVAS